jgi:chemotaxis protein CheZ
MPEATADALPGTTIGERLDTIRTRYPDMDPAMVADVVRAVLGSMRGDLTASETTLLAEVEELGRTIAAAKADIAALRVDDITGDHIPSATDELDAIVAHTATATDQILETCETLDAVGAQLRGKTKAQLQDATTRIYEACSFQDITGQRISKVVAALKTIEQKVAVLVHTFSDDANAPRPPAPALETSLENGPQLPGNAMDQSDIDRLLASFD